MHWSLASILLLAARSVRAAGEPTYPIDVEIDLIFPRPNGTYKRVYPFPVVYAIRNAAALWPFEFFFNIGLKGEGVLESMYLPPPEGYQIDLHSTGDLSGDEDPFYAIFALQDIASEGEDGKVFTDWSLVIPGDCMDFPPEETRRFYIAEGNFTFYLADDGDLPDITAGDECPVPLHAVRVVSISDSGGCVTEAEPTDPDPCQLRPTEEIKARVAAKMVEEAYCEEGTRWPDEELTERCPPEEDSAASSVPGSSGEIIIIAAVTSVLFLAL